MLCLGLVSDIFFGNCSKCNPKPLKVPIVPICTVYAPHCHSHARVYADSCEQRTATDTSSNADVINHVLQYHFLAFFFFRLFGCAGRTGGTGFGLRGGAHSMLPFGAILPGCACVIVHL